MTGAWSLYLLSGLLVIDVASIVDVINENLIRFSTNLKDNADFANANSRKS
jgi:hypothetical protein